jgi:hypothetical protein
MRQLVPVEDNFHFIMFAIYVSFLLTDHEHNILPLISSQTLSRRHPATIKSFIAISKFKYNGASNASDRALVLREDFGQHSVPTLKR